MPKGLLNPKPEEIMENNLDITGCDTIEFLTNGKTVWINIDGICSFRACQFNTLIINDQRPNIIPKRIIHLNNKGVIK